MEVFSDRFRQGELEEDHDPQIIQIYCVCYRHFDTRRRSSGAGKPQERERRRSDGTFTHAFTGKFKGTGSDIKILALGKGKIKIAFDPAYPYIDGSGDLTANTGQLRGEADIKGDTAIFSSSEFGSCTITIKFVRPGTIKVTQEEGDGGCGFGHKVTAEGVYKKTSNAKPKFETE